MQYVTDIAKYLKLRINCIKLNKIIFNQITGTVLY